MLMNAKNTATLALLLSFMSVPVIEAATVITDNFNSLNTTMWGCEFSCPAVSDGFARFNLDPGAVNTNTTWSKLSYKNRTFSYGTYSMTFKYNRRPLEAETWAGWALYSETSGLVNEINFGIETACKQRCNDQTLILESYKNSVNNEVIVPVGVSLFDGTWHTAELTYTASRITLNFDGKQVASITDLNTIPSATMALIPGARVVSGTLTSRFSMDIDSISISDSIASATPVKQREQIKIKLGEKENVQISIYNVAGEKLGTITNSEMNAGIRKFDFSEYLRGVGVFIIRDKAGNSVSYRRIINFK